MADSTGTTNWYDQVSERLGDGGIDIDNDTFVWLLTDSNHVPASSDSGESDIDNELSGNGYSRYTVTGLTWNRSGAISTLDFNNPTFSASDGDLTARNWHMLDTTADLLFAWGLLDDTPDDVVTTDGNTLTANIDASGFATLGPSA